MRSGSMPGGGHRTVRHAGVTKGYDDCLLDDGLGARNAAPLDDQHAVFAVDPACVTEARVTSPAAATPRSAAATTVEVEVGLGDRRAGHRGVGGLGEFRARVQDGFVGAPGRGGDSRARVLRRVGRHLAPQIDYDVPACCLRHRRSLRIANGR
jgi:hypothetical protein